MWLRARSNRWSRSAAVSRRAILARLVVRKPRTSSCLVIRFAFRQRGLAWCFSSCVAASPIEHGSSKLALAFVARKGRIRSWDQRIQGENPSPQPPCDSNADHWEPPSAGAWGTTRGRGEGRRSGRGLDTAADAARGALTTRVELAERESGTGAQRGGGGPLPVPASAERPSRAVGRPWSSAVSPKRTSTAADAPRGGTLSRKSAGEPWCSASEHARFGGVGKGPAQQAPRWRPTQRTRLPQRGTPRFDAAARGNGATATSSPCPEPTARPQSQAQPPEPGGTTTTSLVCDRGVSSPSGGSSPLTQTRLSGHVRTRG